MFILAIGLLLIAAAVSFFYFSYNDGESITVNWMDQTGVFPLAWIPYAILALVLFLLALWILNQIFTVPSRLKRSGEVKGIKKSRDSLDRGLIEIQSGDYEKGEATITSYVENTPGDAVKFIAAAKSAQARGDSERAEGYLKKASDLSSDATPAIRVAQAEMMLDRGNYRDAETLLMNLHQNNPGNGHVMGLLATALQGSGNASKLSDLTRLMRSNTSMPVSSIEPLEVSAWTKIIDDTETADLSKSWESLPGDARKNPSVIASYARKLMSVNQDDAAESVLESAINTQWSDELVTAYGELDNANGAKQLEQLDIWRSKQPVNASLLSAMGKLSAKNHNLNKARDCMVSAAQVDLTPDSCSNLGDVLEALGDHEKAKDCFKSAAALARGESATGVMADIKNLAKNLGAQALKKVS